MEPEDRFKLVEHHDLCLGCLTPGHGRTARSCPYTEERADACQRSACKGRHHHLLHVYKHKAKRGPGKGSLTQPPSVHGDPTPTEDPGCEVQLVAQWVSTKGGVPSLVFWDTGSQVTLVTQKMAHAIGLVAIPSSPLRLEGIRDGHRPRVATRFKVPLVDTGGRVITVTAYGVDNIMSPLGGGDIKLMREAFPEVPTSGLVPASGEVSLLMGQDNLSLFPTERQRVGNAALYMSWFGTGWIASGKPPRARSGGNNRHVEVCVVRAAGPGMAARPKPHEEDTAICALSTVSQLWVAPPLHIEGGIFQPYDFLTAESLGTDLLRRCTSCRRCKECKFRTDCLTFKEDQEYQIILEGLEFNKERRRWRATYPFHIPPSTLKDNYEQVFKYTLAQEKRLAKQGRAEEFNEEFYKTVERGVFKEITREEMAAWDGPVNYISMVEAFKEGPHSTTPLRICMNSSLKQPQPLLLSLNDCLVKGPSALVDLFTVTLCIREHRYALTKDLSKFYQRVDADPIAQNLRRIMWRGGDTSTEMKVYITTTVNFGDKPAG
jgi:hypothetical protein